MTKILCVSEGFILELSVYNECYEYTDIFELSAAHIVDNITPKQFIHKLCNLSPGLYYNERYNRLERRDSKFLESEFELIYD